MARIKIEELPEINELDEQDMRGIFGGIKGVSGLSERGFNPQPEPPGSLGNTQEFFGGLGQSGIGTRKLKALGKANHGLKGKGFKGFKGLV